MTALIVVDLQNDFLEGGSIPLPYSHDVVREINDLVVANHYDVIVATQDWHPENHISFHTQHCEKKPFDFIQSFDCEHIILPPHCIMDTKGAEFPEGINFKFDAVFKKGTSPTVDSYSAFLDNGGNKSTDICDFIKDKGVGAVHIAGMPTEYSVFATAVHSVSLGFFTIVFESCCRGLNVFEDDSQKAISEMRNRGVLVV